jgi:hypothetical protein
MIDKFPWDPYQTATCIRMHLAGDTASTIGRHLGITRNAVIGKVSRLKASGACPHISDEMMLFKKRTQRITNASIAKHKNPVTVRSRLSDLIVVAIKAQKTAPKPALPKLVLVQAAPLEPVGDHAAPLRHLPQAGCRYITEDFALGSGDDAVMCGDQQVKGSAFCVPHKALTLAPVTETVRRNRWRGTVRQSIYYADKYA